MATLRAVMKQAVRYGLTPRELDLTSVDDAQALADSLGVMSGWEPPRFFGVTEQERARARKAWAKLLANAKKP